MASPVLKFVSKILNAKFETANPYKFSAKKSNWELLSIFKSKAPVPDFSFYILFYRSVNLK